MCKITDIDQVLRQEVLCRFDSAKACFLARTEHAVNDVVKPAIMLRPDVSLSRLEKQI